MQKAFTEVLGSLPRQALADLVDEKLAEHGIKLSPRLKRKLQDKLLKRETDVVQFRQWALWDRRQINLTITEEDTQKIERGFEKFLDQKLPDLINNVIDDLSASMLSIVA